MTDGALAPFGLEVRDVEIGQVTPGDANTIRAMIARNRVVVFRDQRADDADLVRFLSALGEITFTDGETPVDDYPDLNIVSNVGRSIPPRSVFHTDTSYVARPPAFTALRAVLLPDVGGNTIFSDQVAALARLPVACRKALAGRTVRHRTTGLNDRSKQIVHPLIRRHPLTDETALYLSTPERCTGISGLDAGKSARIVAALYCHSTRPSHVYRHAWRRGDVLIWDNRVTMHRADHDGVIGDRVLHRGMVLGEAPLAA